MYFWTVAGHTELYQTSPRGSIFKVPSLGSRPETANQVAIKTVEKDGRVQELMDEVCSSDRAGFCRL